MAKITDLKEAVNIKTLNFVLLSIATGGLYNLMWVSRNNEKISKITNKEIVSEIYVIWIAVCIGLGGLFSSIVEDEVLMIIGGLLSIAGTVLYVVWAFKARSAMQDYALRVCKIDFKMNGFYTFIFNIYYINYCSNDLPEEFKKQRMLKQQQEESSPEELI